MTLRKSARFRVGRCPSPYPVHYSRAFAFSAFLYPLRQRRSSRFACRCRQRDGLTLFRTNFWMVRTRPVRRRHCVHDDLANSGHTWPRTFWFEPVSTFGSIDITTRWRTFTCVGRTHPSLAPLRRRAGRFRLASRLGVPDEPAATLSPELHTEPLPAPHVRVGNG